MCKSKKLSLANKNGRRQAQQGPPPVLIHHAIRNTFHKSERLCSRKLIDLLFGRGKSNSVAPIKVMYLPADFPEAERTQAMFVVPKRNFRRAHDRNLLKRRMREAYRLNKKDFYVQLGEKKTLLAFIYTGKKTESFGQVQQSVLKHLSHVAARVNS